MSRIYTIIIIILAAILLFSIIFISPPPSSIINTPEIPSVIASIEQPQRSVSIPPIPPQKPTITIPPSPTKTPIPTRTRPKETIQPLNSKQYRISSVLTNNTANSTTVLIGLSFYVPQNMSLTCGNYTISTASEPYIGVYIFPNTPCNESTYARIEYYLPNGMIKSMAMPMKYETISFKLNISGR